MVSIVGQIASCEMVLISRCTTAHKVELQSKVGYGWLVGRRGIWACGGSYRRMAISGTRGNGSSWWMGGVLAYALFRERHGGRGRAVVLGEWEHAAKLVLSANVAERTFSALPIARQGWPW